MDKFVVSLNKMKNSVEYVDCPDCFKYYGHTYCKEHQKEWREEDRQTVLAWRQGRRLELFLPFKYE